ncbi:MAG: hypothetical protein WD336_10345 [Trueperaceae bacterium]
MEMALHIGAKLFALGLVFASLLTAFRAERPEPLDLTVAPTVQIRTVPHEAVALPDTPHGPVANPTFVLRATGYNSVPAQTNADPHTTATGTRTRPGVLAVSRDLLGADVPYGSMVRLHDLGSYAGQYNPGRFQTLLDQQGLFIVEDTMNVRKRRQVDLWFGDRTSAVNWGVRSVRLEVVRYGYHGPVLDPVAASPFEGRPVLTAASR